MKQITLAAALAFCLLMSACKLPADMGVSGKVSQETTAATAAEPVTAEPEQTTPAVTQEVTTEPPAPEKVIRNCEDVFADGEITVNNSDYRLPEELQKSITDIITLYSGSATAFYVVDLDTQMSVGYSANQYFMTACTIKAGYALSWFKTLEQNRIDDENGVPLGEEEERVRLTDTYLYDGTDHLTGAGKIQFAGPGKTYTVQDLLYHLINESDNTAYNVLYNRFFGNDAYRELTQELGIVPYCGQYGMWTRLRPLDLGLIWQAIWEYHNTHSPEADLFWNYLTHNEFCEIGKVVTDADEIAHKSGSDEYGFHEAGIVSRGGHTYAVAVITTRPLSICDDDYDCCHMIIEQLDRVMKDYYSTVS